MIYSFLRPLISSLLLRKQGFFLLFFLVSSSLFASLECGVSQVPLTPPVGTPLAGLFERKGSPSLGIRDPLFATALVLSTPEKNLAICCVDHWGFTRDMCQEVIRQSRQHPSLAESSIYVISSHTHSGGGGHLNLPVLAENLCGPYDLTLRNHYINAAVEALHQACTQKVPARMGIQYSLGPRISRPRDPIENTLEPLSEIALWKITRRDGSPLALLFQMPFHPTMLPQEERLFSSDFLASLRESLQKEIDPNLLLLYCNGAESETVPIFPPSAQSCRSVGHMLAKTLHTLWDQTDTEEVWEIQTKTLSYELALKPSPFGVTLPWKTHSAQIDLWTFNHQYAFVLLPASLSYRYERPFKQWAKEKGWKGVSLVGFVNDAYGTILPKASWKRKTFESMFCFAGAEHGEWIAERVRDLLETDL